MPKNVIKQVSPIDEESAEADLKFLYHNRSDTSDQFVEQGLALIKNHVNEAMLNYQMQLIEDLSTQMRGEIVNIIVRNKRQSIVEESDDEWSV